MRRVSPRVTTRSGDYRSQACGHFFVIAWLDAALLHISQEFFHGIPPALEALALSAVQRGVSYLRGRVARAAVVPIKRTLGALGRRALDGDRLGVLVLRMMRLCVDFFMFLKILRPFKRLVTDVAQMRFERRMHSYMACNVITFSARRPTVLPVARQAEVVRRLAANVLDTEMIVECFRFRIRF